MAFEFCRRSKRIVSRILFSAPVAMYGATTIHLGEPLPARSSDLPGSTDGQPLTLPYLVLHRMGFTQLPRSPGALVRSYRTLSPLPSSRNRKAVYSLLHLPSRCRDSTLWSILPCGVRTFLPVLRPLPEEDAHTRRSSAPLRPSASGDIDRMEPEVQPDVRFRTPGAHSSSCDQYTSRLHRGQRPISLNRCSSIPNWGGTDMKHP